MEEFYGVGYLEDTDFKGKVLTLSEGNNDIYVVMIWSSWCGHCKKAAPEYQKFADLVKSGVKVCCIQADGTRESEKRLGGKIKEIIPDFRGFPHFCIFKNGKVVKTFDGERVAEKFLKFVE